MCKKQVVVFKLNGYEFGIDIRSVVEILNYEPIRPVPDVPSYIDGIINVRGRICPVINLCKRFGMESGAHESGKFVLIQSNDSQIGLLVDSVTEIFSVQDQCIEEIPSALERGKMSVVESVINDQDRVILVLDLKVLLSEEENLVIEGVTDENNYCSNTK